MCGHPNRLQYYLHIKFQYKNLKGMICRIRNSISGILTEIQIPVQWVQCVVIKIMGKERERSEGVSGNVIVNDDLPIKTNSYVP